MRNSPRLPHPVPVAKAALMRLLRSLPLLLVPLLLTSPARADEAKAPEKAEKLFKVEATKDVAYNDAKDADEKQKLDIYVPKGRKDFPVLFFVHGGTWRSGDRKMYTRVGELFASHGIGTVIISYRLSPKFQHPAHIQDVAKAFAWTCKNIGKYGGKADDIFVCGHSAGGHLVALLATDESYLKAEKRSLADIRGVIPISGVYTIVPIGPLAQAFGKDGEVCKKASPINNVHDKEPPFLIIYADRDLPFLGVMGENLCKKLGDHKCEVQKVEVAKRDHISIMTKLALDDDPTRQAILDFVKKHTEKK
jgi:acetyl esterase/lipase